MKNKYPNLYEGLSQIPKDYLKNNLLPMLEDKNSPLSFNGYVIDSDRHI